MITFFTTKKRLWWHKMILPVDSLLGRITIFFPGGGGGVYDSRKLLVTTATTCGQGFAIRIVRILYYSVYNRIHVYLLHIYINTVITVIVIDIRRTPAPRTSVASVNSRSFMNESCFSIHNYVRLRPANCILYTPSLCTDKKKKSY